MNIDRKLQLDVLHFCRDAYPGRAADAELPCRPDLQANLVYLSARGNNVVNVSRIPIHLCRATAVLLIR